MTKKEKGVLRAMALGDGHISARNTLIIRHCAKQEEYVRHKAARISDILQSPVNVYPRNYNGFPSFQFGKTTPYFGVIREQLYADGKKTITRSFLDDLTMEGVAIWYMDNGSLSRKMRNGKVHAFEVALSLSKTEKEIDCVIEYFWAVWGIEFTKRLDKSAYSIRCGTHEGKRFLDLIGGHIHPSMTYKTQMIR